MSDEAADKMRRVTDGTVDSALATLAPWKRTTMFVLGAIVFSVPILDHVINEIIRGDENALTLLHIGNDGIFLFSGILGMVPQLAIRVLDHLAIWRGIKKS